MLYPGALTPKDHSLESPQSPSVSLVTGLMSHYRCAALRLSVQSLKGSAIFSCKDLTMRRVNIVYDAYKVYRIL